MHLRFALSKFKIANFQTHSGYLEAALNKRKIIYKRQQGIPVLYDHIKMDLGFRADIIIENKVLLEIKSTQTIAPVDAKRVLTYLRFAEIEVGLLINFTVALLKEGITRLVLDAK